MNSFALGRYVPYDGLLHRMDPRAKVFIMIALMVAIFMPYSSWEMTALMQGICLIICTGIAIGAHLHPGRFFASLKSMWFMVLFILAIYIIAPYSTPSLPEAFPLWGNRIVYWDSFAEAGRVILRLLMMLELALSLSATTSPLDLTYALEWYLYPLKLIGFPSHIVAMTIALALRFIPTILEDAQRILKAQASRGVDFSSARIGRKFKALVSLIIPMFVSSFSRSEELADAMEVRGYDPKGKRTRYKKLKFTFIDIFFAVLVALFLAGTIVLAITKFDFFVGLFGMGVHFL